MEKFQQQRVVIIGAGLNGTSILKRLVQLPQKYKTRVVAVVDPLQKTRKQIERMLPKNTKERTHVVPNLSALSALPQEEQPTVAVVTVPAKYQVSTIQTCLKKGWHCLSEKPLGFSTLDCKELQNLAKKQKVKLRVLLPERWSLAQLWSHWKPKKGPWTINALRSGPFLPRSADTNVLHDMMIHDIDMFLLISEVFEMASIKKIRAWGRKLRSQNLDYAIVAFDLEDGGMARFFSSKLSTEIRRSWEMTGPDWHSTIDFKNNEMLKFSAQKRGRLFDAKKSKWGSADPLNHAVKAFLHQVNDHTAAQKYDFSQLSSLSVAPRNILRTHQLMDRILGKIQVIPN